MEKEPNYLSTKQLKYFYFIKFTIMKKLILLSALSISCITYSQNLDYNNSYESINICTAIQGNNFASERAADSALDDILNVIGASKRFVLQECSNINNAVALTMNGVRYIMYDPEFMVSLSYGDEWSNKFILAHEVGHHINGHTVDVLAANSTNRVSLSTRRIQELEADEFAGFVLGRLGATLSEALSGVQSLSDKDDSYSTHPRRSKRIAAIKKGFNESGGYVNPSNVSIKKGKIVDSPYSNSRFSGVEYVTKDFSGGVYTGYVALNSREPFGYGEYRTKNGFIYEGEWSDGDFNGYGKQTWPNGSSYEGYFVSNIRSGEGVYSYDDGTKHIGVFANGTLVKGVKIYEDKQFEGTFNLNGSVIRVTITYKDGREPVEVGFLDGSNGNGLATFTFIDGTKIKATFSNGNIPRQRGLLGGDYGTTNQRNYKGKYYAHKKAIIYPTFVFDFIPEQVQQELGLTNAETYNFNISYGHYVPAALAFLERNKEKKIYNFNLSASVQFYGRGNLTDDWDSAKFINEKYGDYKYVGETLGYGEVTWRGGSVYKGYFYSGSSKDKAGYGEIFYGKTDDRESYKGMWWFDKKNGYGVMKYKDGRTEKGVFRDNLFVKAENFDFETMQKTFKNWY